ncbi:uncharacterized protein LOC108738180 isoform X2 [Agrilus planipennis]|nr:uncharacterized protein LOC108738180 isoform X2 [Agrilus planipennis]
MSSSDEDWDLDTSYNRRREIQSLTNHRLEIMAYIFYHKALAEEVENMEPVGLATPKKGILKRPASRNEESVSDSKKSKRVHFPPEKELETVMEISSPDSSSMSSESDSSSSPTKHKKANCKTITSEIPVFDYRIRTIFDRMKALFHSGLGRFGWDVEILQPSLRLDPAATCTNHFALQDIFSNAREISDDNDLILYRNDNFDDYESDNDIDEFFKYYETSTMDAAIQTGIDDLADGDEGGSS